MGRNVHGRTADQRPHQAANAPQQPDAGVSGDQILAFETLAYQHQRQGINAARDRAQYHQQRPQQPRHVQQPGQPYANGHGHYPARQVQASALDTVGKPAQRQLEQHVPCEHHSHHQCRHAHGKSVAAGIHRQEREHHRIEKREEQHGHAQGRGHAEEAGQAEALVVFSVQHPVIGNRYHNARQRQAIAGRDHASDPWAVGTEHRQHRRSKHLETGKAGGVEGHDLAAVMFLAQFVDPRFPKNDRDAHAKAQRQAQDRQPPQRGECRLQQADAERAQAETQQIECAPLEIPATGIHQERRQHHAGSRDGGNHPDFEGACASLVQAQRHQRQGRAQAEPHDRNGEQQARQQTHVHEPLPANR